MNRDTWVIAALGVLIIFGGWFWFANSSSSHLAYYLTQSGDRQHKENGDLYTIQTVYPDTTPLATRTGAVAEGRAEDAINTLLADQINEFKNEISSQNLSDVDKQRIKTQGPKFSLNIQYHAYSSGTYASYEFDIFSDTGGAHPSNTYKTLVFDLQGNTVALSDLFSSGADYLGRISTAAQQQISQQLAQKGTNATSTIVATGVAPKAENFENFVVDSDRMRILIPPGQAAAYAAGPFEVQVLLTDLKDLLKPNVK
jgi:hypothetical protein